MRIMVLCDKPDSAIDRLSQSIKKQLSHLSIEVVYLHPKRPDEKQIKICKKLFEWCDVLHVAYWRSGEKLKEYVNLIEWDRKTKLCCHYNPYDLVTDKKRAKDMGLNVSGMKWKDDDTVSWTGMYDIVIVGNETMKNTLMSARLINYGIDVGFWKYNDKLIENNVVNMVVARIEGKKGCREVAQVCKVLGYKFVLVGRISKMDYFNQIKAVYEDDSIKWPGERKPRLETMFEFKENITDEELRDVYHDTALHVCNSVSKFESGTLPILESMATGCPVLTRNIGVVADFYDGQNVRVRKGDQDDIEDLKTEMKELMENGYLRDKMKDKGWNTARNWNSKRMAWKFEKIYYELIRIDDQEEQPFVSIIIPTKDRPDILAQCLSKAIVQTYPHKEIVVVDSGDTKIELDKYVLDIERKLKKAGVENFRMPPIKYRSFKNNGEYTLAKARNLGTMDASGELLVFCDERIGMDVDAVQHFVDAFHPGMWLYGMKDEAAKSFVENFSCVSRKELIENGMFNATICSQYGCMTQEIRDRMEKRTWSKWEFRFVNKARAKGICRAHGKAGRRNDIVKSKNRLFKLYG